MKCPRCGEAINAAAVMGSAKSEAKAVAARANAKKPRGKRQTTAAEYYQSNTGSRNPNGNGQPPTLKIEHLGESVRMVVTIASGASMNGAGSEITISDVTVPAAVFEANREILLAGHTKLS